MTTKEAGIQVDFGLLIVPTNCKASASKPLTMKFWTKRLHRLITLLCIITTLLGVLYLKHGCFHNSCEMFPKFNTYHRLMLKLPDMDNLARPLSKDVVVAYEDLGDDAFSFEMSGNDVIVFLHIQKTGGTIFGRHLVQNLDLDRPCLCHRKKKRCDCFRPNTKNEQWLFSRYSTGWKCGLHADWTELTSCVDSALDAYERQTLKRRYFYITILRDPIHRYLSEFRHVQRGATWKATRHWCGGRQATEAELPHCYQGTNWTGVTLEEFMQCPYNPAANRQTRMLADLTLIGCYNSSLLPSKERDQLMLASAKTNLAKMAFFGMTEEQQISQYIFEETFGLHFLTPFEQFNTTLSLATLEELKPSELSKIQDLNALDIELYAYAKQLFNARFKKLLLTDQHFEKHWRQINDSIALAPSDYESEEH
uniref:Heparan-sulfate 6-O-sulfotransferase n=1 Tax=Lynceus sp. MCZ IZ 141354 TaxID=1930659 RepID=A0A9N6WRL5_9CRUS|nr:EOG090X0E58 [Lynceus sp. MCZ IZ 141354]